MSYIRGGSDYSMIQSQAAMLKHLWEQDRKQKELLKRALKELEAEETGLRQGLGDLIFDIRQLLKA